MNITKTLGLAGIVFGVFFLLFSVIVIGAPIFDLGMLSTAVVFILLGVLGLALSKSTSTN